ncbi:MAG: hypothetical protein WC279_13045 [Sulfurimonas sp.]|uniref:hypothetical protein n=1 Tax=Sulfurimonas sp. TaxID=2022749 RepID=UPI00355E6686|nr:hypothetical protein [Dehalococcoidia bacterium]
MTYLLMAGPRCTQCCDCEEWLNGFVSQYGGRQVVSATWMENANVLESIRLAREVCPVECIAIKEIKKG